MNLFDSKLVKVDGKYVVELGGQTVVLSDEKQEKLAANNVEEKEIVLEQGIVGKVDVSELMGSSVHLYVESMGRNVVMVVSTMNFDTEE